MQNWKAAPLLYHTVPIFQSFLPLSAFYPRSHVSSRRGAHPCLFGTRVVLWRGVPLIPSDKVEVEGQYLTGRGVGTTKIILVRVGEKSQGVIGLHQSGIPGEIAPSLSARLMGLDKFGVASYLLTKYFSLAALTDDAIAVLENVEVGYYHDYQHRNKVEK